MKTGLLTAAAVVLCGVAVASAEIDPDELSAGNALGGADVLAVVKNAATVTAQRVDSEIAETRESAPAHPVLIPLGEPFVVPAPEAAALCQAFASGKTHLGQSKVCEFRANVRYVFRADGHEPVEIILCFGCGELEVRRNGEVVGFGPFDGGYGTLLGITKKLFPDDEFLAAFSEADFIERSMRLQRAPAGPSGAP